VALFVRCGSGLSGECLTEDGHMWIGLDISSSMLGDVFCTCYVVADMIREFCSSVTF